MENGHQPTYPAPREFRAQARAALGRDWKRAINIAGVVALVTSLDILLMSRMLLDVLPGNASALPAAAIVPMILLLLLYVVAMVLILPLPMIVISRIARRAVIGEPLDWSLIHMSPKELLRGVRVLLVTAWRVMFVPMLLAYLLMFAHAILSYTINFDVIPWKVYDMLLIAVLLVLLIWMLCRMMYYTPVYQLMVLMPDAGALELAYRSKAMMKGHRLRLFGMNLSFFGWVLLYEILYAVGEGMLGTSPSDFEMIVFGLAFTFIALPLNLYMQTALAAFTKDLIERG